MSLGIAIKAFFKAWKNPKLGQKFVEETTKSSNESAATSASTQEPSHLRLLSLLQQSSRFIDFLKEDISSFNDAQVGAAVRKIHLDCGKSLEELVTIRPVVEDREGATIQIPKGYDSAHIKIVGKVKGEPPYSGVLVHKGWKAHKRSLPKKVGEQLSDVIFPAEVEIK